MSRLISVDLEFNKEKEVLSAGLLHIENMILCDVNEFFFENKVDKHTYKIHGLSEEFLRDNCTKNVSVLDLKNLVRTNDYIIGFDLHNDFDSLSLNPNTMYGERRVIDIKHVMSFFGTNGSLESISKKMGIFSKCKGMFPVHTAIMDSFLSYLIFEYIVVFLVSEEKLSKEEILNDLADMSSSSYFGETWKYDHYYEKLFSLYREFGKIKDTKVLEKKNESRKEVHFANHVEVYDANFNIVSKIKRAKTKEPTKFFKPELCIGFKD